MAKYNVYGIGNALVDIDFEVSEETLKKANIDKGVMTLIEKERLIELLEDIAGEKHVKSCGGSVANTLFTLHQMKSSVFYSCRVANDKDGDFFYESLQQNGIATNLTDSNRPDGDTGKCMVFVTKDADRTMNTYLGATQGFSVEQLVESEIKQSEYLYIEGYLVASDSARAAAIKAREIAEANGVKTVLSLSDPNMVQFFKQGLIDIIDNKVDLLFCNEAEALLFCDTDDLEQAKTKLQDHAKQYVITRGQDGCILYDGNTFDFTPATQAKAIDTVGAGDVFSGAFLHGICQGMSFKNCARLAADAAATVVQKFGPRLSDTEAEQVLHHFQTEAI